MKKRIVLFITAILLGSVSAGADVVTLIRGGQPLGEVSSAAAGEAIELIFEEDVLLISKNRIASAGGKILRIAVDRTNLYVLKDMRDEQKGSGYETLYNRHGYRLAIVSQASALSGSADIRLTPVTRNMTVLKQTRDLAGIPDPTVLQVLDRLDEATYAQYLNKLATDYASRLSCTNEILSAGYAIEQQFRDNGLETLRMSFNNFCIFYPCKEPKGYNSIGIKRGSTRPGDIYLVGAHYDSTSNNACTNAPGANDNASGTAGVMELARVFGTVDTEATLVFVAFSGEEQGLYGSEELVELLNQMGLDGRIKAFVILDMIAYWTDDYGVIVEGSDANAYQSAVLNKYEEIGATYTDLTISTSTQYCCSDHEPFLDNGQGGALFIETDWDQYNYYHTTNDLPEYQDTAYGLEIVKFAGAVLATGGGVISPDK